MTPEEIECAFTHHIPFGSQQTRYEYLRENAKILAQCISDSCPDSREKSLAFTRLREAAMWANASIAINE